MSFHVFENQLSITSMTSASLTCQQSLLLKNVGIEAPTALEEGHCNGSGRRMEGHTRTGAFVQSQHAFLPIAVEPITYNAAQTM